jgi:hypothetical protein
MTDSPPRRVRDDPARPDPAFAELYASLPDATDLEPWLGWCRAAGGPVLYLGIGAGRLAVPLAGRGVELVGVDSHPGMLGRLHVRAPSMELVRARIEDLVLDRPFPLVIAPSNILCTHARLAGAARHVDPGGRLGFELMNPHWLRAGAAPEVAVLAWTGATASIEVTYPGGAVQPAEVPLIWPEDVERFLAGAGLDLVWMGGAGDEVESSSTIHVLCAPAGILSRDDP